MSSTTQDTADLQRIADGFGDEYNNDELLRLGIGYGIPGPLSDEQVRREAAERLSELSGSELAEAGDMSTADGLGA